MIQNYDLVIISKLCSFNLLDFETKLVLITCDPIVILFSLQNSVYVICICLIKYDLGCEVDLSRPSLYSTDYRVYISDGMRMSTCLTGIVILNLV